MIINNYYNFDRIDFIKTKDILIIEFGFVLVGLKNV